MRVLIVEDEVKMASLIRRGFREEGLAADVATKGEDAMWMAGSTAYDAIVLDVMLPGMDGFATVRALRDEGVWPPVLMLTARDAIEDRIAGLDGGADDYLTKPFSFGELLARVRALSRRGSIEQPTVLSAGDLHLDPAGHRVWRGETDIELSSKEFSLLEAFMRRPGDVLSRFQLLERACEAGGVLLGYIRGPHFHILAATEPGSKDRRTRTSFHRRDKMHEQHFLKAREKDPFVAYLGDWHSHPEDTPTPSSLDEREWKLLRKNISRRCVCLIQGRKTIAGYLVLPNNVVVTLDEIGVLEKK